MLQSSVLGVIYGLWLDSRAFAFLRAIFRFFSKAFGSSAFLRLVTREPFVERAYSRSLIAGAVMAVGDLFLGASGLVLRTVSRLGAGSLTFRAVRFLFGSSEVFNFEFMLGGFVFAMFAVPHGSWSNTYALYGGIAFLALYLLLAAAGKRPLLRFHELGLPFTLFAMACLFSLFFSNDRADTLRVLMFYIAAFILMYVLAADLSDEARLSKLMGFVWLAVIFTSCYAVLQRFAGVEVDFTLTDSATNKGVPGRVFSTLDNANNFAEFLVLFTPLAAAFAMNVKNPTRRVMAVGLMLFPFLALVMTYSRSGWLSMLLAAAVFVYFANKRIIPLVLLLCIAAIPLLPDSVITRFDSIFSNRDTSIAHRFYVWQSAIKLLRDNWQTGIGLGPGSFALEYPSYAHIYAEEGVPHSHMLWMEITIETGILGLFSFLWLMLRSVKNAACGIGRSDGPVRYALIACAASFTGIAVSCTVEYIWYYPRVLFAFFILLGICMAASRMRNGHTTQDISDI